MTTTPFTDILLIRHGETAWNAVRRIQGHLDIPLNEAGIKQADALGRALTTEKLDAIFSSDLQRASQTAAAIAQYQHQDFTQDPRLRERCFGGFEGVLNSDLQEKFPSAYQDWQARNPEVRFPAAENNQNYVGESMREFHARCLSAIEDYAARFQGGKIALVAHGGVLECAYRAAKHLALNAPREVTILNASINRFQASGSIIKLVHWGDIAHLDMLSLDES